MFQYRSLEVYKKAKAFHISCKRLVEKGKYEPYVRDQLLRASFSVPLNIAEGSGKFSGPDRKNYFSIARASVFECVAILDILKDDDNLKLEPFTQFEVGAEELSRMLYTMIKNLS